MDGSVWSSYGVLGGPRFLATPLRSPSVVLWLGRYSCSGSGLWQRPWWCRLRALAVVEPPGKLLDEALPPPAPLRVIMGNWIGAVDLSWFPFGLAQKQPLTGCKHGRRYCGRLLYFLFVNVSLPPKQGCVVLQRARITASARGSWRGMGSWICFFPDVYVFLGSRRSLFGPAPPLW